MDVTNFLKSFDNVMGGKWVASAIGALLVFMLLGFMSGQIYGTRGGHHGPEELAFALEIEEAVVEEEEDEAVDYQALLASVDLGEGEKFFKKCASCHKVADGENGVGPHLYGVVGRDIGSVGDYAYSSTLSGLDGNWTLTALDGFLANPKGWAPGTSMGYAGAKNPEDRINVIAWLNEQGGAPIDLAEGLEVAAASDAEVMTDAEAEVAEPVEEVAEAVEEVTEEVTETAEAAVEEVTEEVAETAEEVTEEVTETAEAVTEEVTEEVTVTAEAATEEATETAEAVTEEVSETAEAATEEVTETAEATTEEATETAEAATEEVTETAETATEEVTETAEAATEEVTETAEAATEEATETAEATTEEATETAEAAEEATEEQIAAATPEPVEEEPAVESPFAAFLAAADPDQGKKVFRKCRACHKLAEGDHAIGPSLHGVVGREIGSVEGYKYSGSLANYGGVWSLAELDGFLTNPRAHVKGTKMAFGGLKDQQDRIDVITYLNEADGSPEPLN